MNLQCVVTGPVNGAHSRNKLLTLAQILLFLVPLSFNQEIRAENIQFGSRKQPGFGPLILTGTEIFRSQDTTEDIRLKPVSHNGDKNNLLYLDFENDPPVLLKDVAGNFKIKLSSYIFSSDSYAGRGAAYFNRRENKILIDSPEELWPGTGRINNFSIELSIKPNHFSWKNMIFKKAGISSSLRNGIKKSIELYISNKKIHFLCHNVFKDIEGRNRIVQLVSRTPIEKGKWTHILVSYRSSDGKLILFLNGREERVRYAADTYGIWEPAFEDLDRTPIRIGGNFFGIMDEFRISKTYHDNANNIRHTPFNQFKYNPISLRGRQKTGIVTSHVIALPASRISRFARLSYGQLEPKGSALNFWIRYSHRSFHEKTTSDRLPWKLIRGSAEIPEFSYFQWKAELRADPEGKVSPVLKDIRLEYSPYRKPSPPRRLKVIAELTGENRVCLEWLENPESALRSRKGAYVVRYGFKSGNYTGKLTYRQKSGKLVRIRRQSITEIPLTVTEKKMQQILPEKLEKYFSNRVRFCMTNDLIESNIVKQIRHGWRIRMPFIQRHHTYFLSVSFYYYTRNGIKIESSFSDELSVAIRPNTELR